MPDAEYNEEEIRELKLLKGKNAATIANEIEESVEHVAKICEVASKYLSDYDAGKIMDELRKVTA